MTLLYSTYITNKTTIKESNQLVPFLTEAGSFLPLTTFSTHKTIEITARIRLIQPKDEGSRFPDTDNVHDSPRSTNNRIRLNMPK